ncbi:hypothetical protein PSDVSF_21850 [Pseudodesulfovibrio sediminis]|uniref:histidine kinase n=2 Tax=Pseudodesulfovibrio sediminis TaxID=2810563 RepID=A0ABM7P7L3_9BACT|nr:hypothetical protein PSDVSF_21850 [Pseudodesulfovibrio sediminis]
MCLRKILILLLAALVLAGYAVPSAAQSAEKKQILLLNSYHQNFPWNEEIFRGLNDVLRPRETGIVLHVENMDTKRVDFNEHYMQQLKAVFEHKYRSTELELIMVTDNNALEFMRRYHEDLFPKVPVVFCGINNFQPELIEGHPLFTGVAENENAKGTLAWALRFHPETKTVFIINDWTSTGRAVAETIKRQLQDFEPVVNIRYSENKPLAELLKDVGSLPRNALIIYGIYNRDQQGRFYDIAEAANAVTLRAKVPVYALVDFDLGQGIVGGLLTNGYSQGQSMAQLALHVLAGRRPRDIPVLQEGATTPMFDYTLLKQYSISLVDLPDESIIINRPGSFYTEHGPFIWLGVGLAVFQTVIILLLVFNISRRRMAEKSLRGAHKFLEQRVRDRTSKMKDSEQALRAVFDSSHDAIFIHTVHGRIMEGNKRMLKMYGLESDQNLGQLSIAEDLSSRDNSIYRLSAVWRDVLNGTPHCFEWRAKRPGDGFEFIVEVYLNRITYKGQDAILANVRDISVRKESENRMRQTLTKLEAILENTLMGIAMTRNKHLSTINLRGAAIFGYTPGELIGDDLTILIGNEEEQKAFISTTQKALLVNGEFNTEQAFKHKDGSTIWCRLYVKTVDPTNLTKGAIWAWDDITESRRVQEDLVRTREDAEAASRAKSEFLAAMSHEIRTPMNAIVGMTDITLQTDLTDDQRDYLGTVKDSAQHLLSIINDILDLSKIEAQKLELDHTDFNLPFHVQATIKGLKMQAREKGLEMRLSIDESLPACVNGDPLSLRQILVNLVGNAIKFTHRGTIEIRVLPAPPETGPSDPNRTIGVTFEVEDTGIGIPREFLDTVFQSFSQTTRAFGGTGLGLAICKELISLMGGEIMVESAVGVGSTFSFNIWFEPGVSCPIPVAERRKLPDAPTRPVHILVAEDNDVNVMVTTLKLDDLGYSYSVAGTGLEVLELLKREPFDLILMDIEMPVLDGISTTKAIRSAIPGGGIPDPNIPIIGVTAHALKEFREKSLGAGMDDYISKPVDFHELALSINHLIGSDANPAPASFVEGTESSSDPTPEEAIQVNPELPWEPENAMEYLDVDQDTFNAFVMAARMELTSLADEIVLAFEEGDDAAAQQVAHTIKSVCASIGAGQAASCAAAVEASCRDGKDSTEPQTRLEEALKTLFTLMEER